MHNRIWRKPLHQRKLWKEISVFNKIQYYMKPFALHLVDIWLQPLPFPTIIKFIYSMILIVLIFLPIIYPTFILLTYYAILQYNIEITFNIRFIEDWDLIHPVYKMLTYQEANEKHILFLQLYIERWRFLATALASFIDHVRLIMSLLMD